MTRLFTLIVASALLALAAPGSGRAQTIEPVRAGDRVVGAADAPVTLTVYVSTTCSHCAHWHSDDYPAFRTRFVDTGRVKVAFRDLPTPPADLAFAGAMIARCAPEARFEAVLDALFKGQATYFPARQARGWLLAGATAGGLDAAQATACLRDAAGASALQARIDQSQADGVTGTPAFFVDGRRLPETSGHDVTALAAVIDPLLAGR